MANKQAVISSILAQRVLPLFFYEDIRVSLQVTRTLYKAGINVLEYTNRGEAALENFKALKKLQREELPRFHLGIGTVKTAKEAEDFIAAGADFIVSPIINPDVAKLAHERDMLWIPGCMTPTEIFQAQENEARIIKIFPANILGPEFIWSVKELFRGQLFIPTGGVELESANINSWFKAGVCAVGLGSKLISKKILDDRLYDDLYQSTLMAMEMVKNAG